MSLNVHLADPDPELGPLLSKLGPPAPPTDDVRILRSQFEVAGFLHRGEWESRAASLASQYRVRDHYSPVEAEDGGEAGQIQVRCCLPQPTRQRTAAVEGGVPVLVWYHGGGGVSGSLDVDDAYLRTVCVEMQLAIVSVGYRLAPEHVFPTGFNDAYAGLKWTAGHAAELGVSLAKGFIVGGTSSGATLAAAVALRARDDPFFAPGSGRQVTGQLLQTPQVVHPEAEPGDLASELRSMEELADAPFLTTRKLRAFAKAVRAPPNDPRISPLLAPSHAGLPRAYIQVFGLDPLRDEGLLYARLLRESTVETKLDVYPGCPHTFNMIFPGTQAGRRVDREFREGIRWLLAVGDNSQTPATAELLNV